MPGNDRHAIRKADKWLSLKEAAQFFESKPAVRTVQGWALFGVHNRTVPDGKGPRIMLKAEREGGFIRTTLEWIVEFKRACQANRKTRSK